MTAAEALAELAAELQREEALDRVIDAANAVAAEGLRRVSRDVAEAMAPRKVAALALAELRAQRHGPWTAAELREWLATLPLEWQSAPVRGAFGRDVRVGLEAAAKGGPVVRIT